MRTDNLVGTGMVAAVAWACGVTAPDGTESGPASDGQRLETARVEATVTGGGQFEHPTLGTVTFAFVANRLGDGRVTGRLHQEPARAWLRVQR
ncbi:MAG: hypothetical protein ACREMZ_03535 [Gemmatimonadales bacterium]